MTNELTLGFDTLGADLNKLNGRVLSDTKEGVVSPKFPELTLDMSDEELVSLLNKREKAWIDSDKVATWKKIGEEDENYWLGKQYEGPRADKRRPMVDNMIFESLETYLPQATSRNPDPHLEFEDPNEAQGQDEYLVELKEELAEIADKNKLRLKLKRATRYWSLYLLGILKYSWDLERDIPKVTVIRPQKIILDPDAPVTEDGYEGNIVGEHIRMQGSKALEIMQKHGSSEQAIKMVQDLIDKETGTYIQFVEWTTAEYSCWKMKDTILLKTKNLFWNYGGEAQTVTDAYGNQTPGVPKPGFNHFKVPKINYSFMSVFNLGDQPMDRTGLIPQNLSNQDRINKVNRQITKGVDNMNNGLIVSLERSGLTETQAKTVSKAIQNGGVVCIPQGAPQEAVYKMASPPLPPDVYNNLNDMRTRLRDIYGVRGSSAAGIADETTVRGKLVSRTLDTDRIGGGVSEYLEQLADEFYNWSVQLLYVFGDKYQQYRGAPPAVEVSVKEGSLLPKDSTTIANQAIQLAEAGKMSTLDLYKRLEYPNPEELAANAWLEANAPQLLFKDNPLVQEAVQTRMQSAQVEAQNKMDEAAARSIKFSDLPPEGQVQLAAKAGITLTSGSVVPPAGPDVSMAPANQTPPAPTPARPPMPQPDGPAGAPPGVEDLSNVPIPQ